MPIQPQENWDRTRAKVWHKFSPPARPSAAEVAIYEGFIRQENADGASTCLLLGSTPEVRSAAHRHHCRIVCADCNEDVFHGLCYMVDPPGVETFVCSDWREMVEVPSPVGLVVADGSLNMLPRGDHGRILDEVHRLLRPGGLAVVRMHVRIVPRFPEPAAVFEWYRQEIRGESVFTATRTYLDMLWAEPGSNMISFPEYHQRIEALFREGEVTEDEYEAYADLIRVNRIKLYYSDQREFESQAAQRFAIEQTLCGNDYPGAEAHPIYVLRKHEKT